MPGRLYPSFTENEKKNVILIYHIWPEFVNNFIKAFSPSTVIGGTGRAEIRYINMFLRFCRAENIKFELEKVITWGTRGMLYDVLTAEIVMHPPRLLMKISCESMGMVYFFSTFRALSYCVLILTIRKHLIRYKNAQYIFQFRWKPIYEGVRFLLCYCFLYISSMRFGFISLYTNFPIKYSLQTAHSNITYSVL